MNAEAYKRQLCLAAENPQGREARRELTRCLALAMAGLGRRLRVGGHLIGPQRVQHLSPFGNGDDGVVSLGYVCEIAAAMTSGVSIALESANRYAAAALNRQLVETEFLAWAFAHDQEEAADWLRSSQKERQNRWQPRHLRDRSNGRFRGSDYSIHCEFGGHPTPAGARHYLNCSSEDADLVTEMLWIETANHGLSTWHYLTESLDRLGYESLLTKTAADGAASEAAAVATAEAQWQAHDQLRSLAGQVPTP